MPEIPGHPQPLFRGLLRGWKRPGDVTSLLMIANGDVVQKALAQLSGPTLVPVAFSLAWVVYSIQAFLTVIGTGRLMPAAPDVESIVINLATEHPRANRSWILGRLLRDWDYKPSDKRGLYITVLDAVDGKKVLRPASVVSPLSLGPELAPLTTSADPDLESGQLPGVVASRMPMPLLRRCANRVLAEVGSRMRPMQTWIRAQDQGQGLLWVFAWAVIVVQWVVACIPLFRDHDAFTLVLTSSGTFLALSCGSLRRWSEEKWCCRANTKQNFALLEGNGGQHLMVLYGNGVGLNFEDLAGGRVSRGTKPVVYTLIQALLWVVLLIAIAREGGQTWYLVTVGGLGLLQNIVVAGAPRPPSAFKIYLERRRTFHKLTVRDTLCEAEEEIANLGTALRPICFPGKSTKEDDEAFENAVTKRNRKRELASQAMASEAEVEDASRSGRAGAAAGRVNLESS